MRFIYGRLVVEKYPAWPVSEVAVMVEFQIALLKKRREQKRTSSIVLPASPSKKNPAEYEFPMKVWTSYRKPV